MPDKPVKTVSIIKVDDATGTKAGDFVAVEEPLEIRLEYGPLTDRKVQNISVTMRTPGNDAELAAGFLFTEGIIKNPKDITAVEHRFIACAEDKENTIQLTLKGGITPNLNNSERNFYTTSSCGVCGKGSISAIRTVSVYAGKNTEPFAINAGIIYGLPGKLRKNQAAFADTGGIHASGLFNANGELLLLREDVGRHNALDKIIGAALNKNWLPLDKHILLLSGRASFELVQKAAMAGITIIAAVGAPSSLAVELAEELNIALIGFLRNSRFNIYNAAHRILLPLYETAH